MLALQQVYEEKISIIEYLKATVFDRLSTHDQQPLPTNNPILYNVLDVPAGRRDRH